MAAITASYAYPTEQLIRLNSESLSRIIDIGTDWTFLRIGIAASIDTHNTYSALVNTDWALGLCNGSSSYGDASTTHFLGIMSAMAVNNTFTSASVDWGGSNNVKFGRKIGATKYSPGSTATQRFGGMTGSAANLNPASVEKRRFHYINFFKADTDPGLWLVTYGYRSSAAVNVQTINEFYQSLTEETQSLTSYTAGGIATLIPITESVNGNLNSLNIFWNCINAEYKVYAVGVYRFR